MSSEAKLTAGSRERETWQQMMNCQMANDCKLHIIASLCESLLFFLNFEFWNLKSLSFKLLTYRLSNVSFTNLSARVSLIGDATAGGQEGGHKCT